jgi:hypothetical protein
MNRLPRQTRAISAAEDDRSGPCGNEPEAGSKGQGPRPENTQ